MSDSDFERVKRVLSLVGVDPGQCPPEDPHCQPHTLLKQVALSNGIYKANENAEVSQWLSLSRGLCEGTAKKSLLLTQLDSTLQTKSYLLSSAVSFGLADIAVFDALQQPKVAPECKPFRHVCRWAHQMSELLSVPLAWDQAFEPTVFGVNKFSSSSIDDSKVSDTSNSEEVKENEVEKKEIPPMSAKQIAKQKEKAAKKEKAKNAPAPTQEKAGDDLDPSKLDFRVGRVLKCWPHPKAEKLLW